MKKFKRKVLAMLMTNNFGSSLRQQLFDSAPFCSELLYTAIPQRAASGTTATFTRATTSTWPNNDGYMVTGVAGEIGFPGARRVYNKIPVVRTSENLSGWDKTGVTVESDQYVAPNGSTTMDKILASAGNTTHLISIGAAAPVIYVAGVNIFSVYLRYINHRYAYIAMNDGTNVPIVTVDLLNGTIANTTASTTATIEQDDSGAYRVSCKRTMVSYSFGSVYVGLNNTGAAVVETWNAVGTEAIGAWGLQVEDVTAQTTQTAGEYVSVGVESAPYYHGSMVDGVKCFPTDLSGNPIPSTTLLGYQAQGARTNLCLQSNAFTTTWTTSGSVTSAQNAVGPSGAANEAWTLGDTDAANISDFRQEFVIANDAVLRGYQIRVGKTVGAATFPGVGLLLLGGTFVAGQWTVNTDTGVLAARSSNAGTVAATIESVGNFWLIKMSATNNSTGNVTARIQMMPAVNADASGTWAVAATGTAVFAYAGFEVGWPSSYIATTTIAVARNKDEESVSTSGNIAAAAGSIYLEYTPTHAPSGTVAFWGTYVDASNYTAILHDATNLIFRKRIAGVNYDATIANAFVAGTTYKACATWGAAGTSITLNGTEGTPHANTTAAQIAATMQWGADGNSLQQPFASIRNCRDWLRQLSASERAAVTA